MQHVKVNPTFYRGTEVCGYSTLLIPAAQMEAAAELKGRDMLRALARADKTSLEVLGLNPCTVEIREFKIIGREISEQTLELGTESTVITFDW